MYTINSEYKYYTTIIDSTIGILYSSYSSVVY